MCIIPAFQYPAFHEALVQDVGAKTKASLAVAGQIDKIGAAVREKDAALARLAAFNRGDLVPGSFMSHDAAI